MLNLQSRKEQVKEARAQDRLTRVLARPLFIGLSTEFNRVAHTVAADYMHHHYLVAASSMNEHRRRLQPILERTIKLAMRASARRTKMALRHGMKATQDEIDAEVDDYIDEFVATKVSDISSTTEKRIVKAVKDANDDELGYEDTAKLIARRTGGAIGLARARIIAHTEMHSAAQAGSIFSARSVGIDGLQKKWIATNDDRTRDDHAEADNQVQDMEDPFDVGNDELDYPGDPSGSPEEVINCRCVMIYTLPGLTP